MWLFLRISCFTLAMVWLSGLVATPVCQAASPSPAALVLQGRAPYWDAPLRQVAQAHRFSVLFEKAPAHRPTDVPLGVPLSLIVEQLGKSTPRSVSPQP